MVQAVKKINKLCGCARYALVFILVTFSSTICSCAELINVPELNMNIPVIEGMLVITRSYASDENALLEAGLSTENIRQSFMASDIFYNAIDPDFGFELVVSNAADSETIGIWNMSLLSEKKRTRYIDTVLSAMKETGAQGLYTDIYEVNGATYLVFDVQKSFSGGMAYGRQYHTVYNGDGVNIMLWSYTGAMPEDAQREMQLRLVEGIEFTATYEKPAGKYAAILSQLGAGVFFGALLGGALALVRLIKEKLGR